jgi:hypothetical protein
MGIGVGVGVEDLRVEVGHDMTWVWNVGVGRAPMLPRAERAGELAG